MNNSVPSVRLSTVPLSAILCAGALLFGAVMTGSAAIPLYINSAPVSAPPMVPPQIDAIAWVNRAPFGITNVFGLSALPFESQSTLFFTNVPAPAGTMSADPGFRFLHTTGSQRSWMDTWENQGIVVTDHATFANLFGASFLIDDARASILHVAATNIISTGPLLQSGAQGIIHLEGRRIDVTRNALRTGNTPLPQGLFGGGFASVGATNYANDFGITDIYWGTGTNGTFDGSGGPMPIDGTGFRPDFTLPLPSSPTHEVLQVFFGNTFLSTVGIPFGGTFGGAYAVAVNSTVTSPTSSVVQVVFYPTNLNDPEASAEVRFAPSFSAPGGSVVTVAFRASEFDIATQSYNSNAVFLTDALAATTNVFLSRNAATGTRRPSPYEVSRLEPFTFSSGSPGNSTFTDDLLYKTSYEMRFVTNRYTAYSAMVDLISFSPSGHIPYGITNVPGRIEIFGDRVDLSGTRIRAESAFLLKANNLVSNSLPQVDAPLLSVDIRSTQPTLTISNLAPPTVKRFAGTLRAWSSIWENREAAGPVTNTTTYHVLIVDSELRSILPVSVNTFAARATNVVIADQLTISNSFVIEGNSWHVQGGLNLPIGIDLAATNIINVQHFTNDGVINMTGGQWFGSDRTQSYANYVNHGTNRAGAHFIRAQNFDNTGLLEASGGLLSIDALTASLVGNPQVESTSVVTNIFFDFFLGLQTNIVTVTNVLSPAPKLQGVGEVQLNVRDLYVSNSIINAGRLILSVTNSLIDSGTNGINQWNVVGGFSATRLPTTSDLRSTLVRSTAPRLQTVNHTWAGRDLGTNTAGYTNNLALGRLILDGGSNSTFRFFGAGTGNALYVDYLQLDNFATNYNAELAIAQGFTIYFANANIPATKLDGAAAGRLIWVRDYAGALSSTNITYYFTNGTTITTNVYTFNLALVTSRDLDSDFDGTVNADDATPIYVDGSATLAVALAPQPLPYVELGWNALAYSRNHVEYKSPTSENWQVLTNFLHGPYTSPVRILDPIPSNGARVYRLRVDRGPFLE